MFDGLKIRMPPEDFYELRNAIKRIPDVFIEIKMHRFNNKTMEPELSAIGKSLRIEDEIYVTVNGARSNWKYPLKVAMQK